jgi:hypothetical protein
MTPRQFILATSASLLVLSSAAQSAVVNQTTNAASTNPTWNDTTVWGGAAPAPGNTYVTTSGLMASTNSNLGVSITGRVRDNGTTFGGDSLTISSGTELLLKQNSVSTPATTGNVILNGGVLRLAPNSPGPGALAGTLNIAANSVLGAVSTGAEIFTISSTLTGSASLRLAAGGGSTTNTILFNGDLSGYTGTILVGGGDNLVTVDFALDYNLPNLSLAYDGIGITTLDDLNLTNNITVGSFTFGTGANATLAAGTYTAAQLNATYGNGSQFTGAGSLTVVPEPCSAVSLLGGVGMLLGLRRRRAA